MVSTRDVVSGPVCGQPGPSLSTPTSLGPVLVRAKYGAPESYVQALVSADGLLPSTSTVYFVLLDTVMSPYCMCVAGSPSAVVAPQPASRTTSPFVGAVRLSLSGAMSVTGAESFANAT